MTRLKTSTKKMAKEFLHWLDFFISSHHYYSHCLFVRLSFFLITDKPDITVHPKAQAATEGNNATFTCNAIGNPVPTISWTINGSSVDASNNSRISFSEGKKQLTITNVNRTDSGEYQCVASNSLGNDTSNTATLDVQCM